MVLYSLTMKSLTIFFVRTRTDSVLVFGPLFMEEIKTIENNVKYMKKLLSTVKKMPEINKLLCRATIVLLFL